MEASANGVADDSLDRVFFALSDPTRRAIVEQLLDGPRRVGELVLPRNIAAPTLSKHLSVLMKSGLLTQQSQGRARLCRLNTSALRPIKDWVEQHQPRVKSQRAALERYFGVATGTA